jgi:hypothetical protein
LNLGTITLCKSRGLKLLENLSNNLKRKCPELWTETLNICKAWRKLSPVGGIVYMYIELCPINLKTR